jgi:hypothetical protein
VCVCMCLCVHVCVCVCACVCECVCVFRLNKTGPCSARWAPWTDTTSPDRARPPKPAPTYWLALHLSCVMTSTYANNRCIYKHTSFCAKRFHLDFVDFTVIFGLRFCIPLTRFIHIWGFFRVKIHFPPSRKCIRKCICIKKYEVK